MYVQINVAYDLKQMIQHKCIHTQGLRSMLKEGQTEVSSLRYREGLPKCLEGGLADTYVCLNTLKGNPEGPCTQYFGTWDLVDSSCSTSFKQVYDWVLRLFAEVLCKRSYILGVCVRRPCATVVAFIHCFKKWGT